MKCINCKTEIKEEDTECPGCGNPVDQIKTDQIEDVDEKELFKFWERLNKIICAEDNEIQKYDDVANPGIWQLIIDMSETLVNQLISKHPVFQYNPEETNEQLKGIFYCGLRSGYFINLIENKKENTPVPFHERVYTLDELRELLFGKPFNEEAMWRFEMKPIIKEVIALYNDLMIEEKNRVITESESWSDDLKNEVNSLIFSSIINGYKIAKIEEELNNQEASS